MTCSHVYLSRGVLSSEINFGGHAKFVAKELEKIQKSEVEGHGTATPPVDPSIAAERNELSRAAQAVGA